MAKQKSTEVENIKEAVGDAHRHVRHIGREVADDVGHTASRAARDVSDVVTDAYDKTAENLSHLGHRVSRDASYIAEDVSDRASHLVGRVSAEARNAKRYAKEELSSAGDAIEGYVNKNPLGAVAAALGVGFVLGLLMRK